MTDLGSRGQLGGSALQAPAVVGSQTLCSRHNFLGSSSVANKARILSESAPHSAFWLSMVPSTSLGLHFEPNEF